MFYRENGQFKTSYRSDQQIFAIAQDRWAILAFIAFAFVGVPFKVLEAEQPEAWRALLARDPEFTPPEGESHRQCAARMSAALDEILARHATGTVVVFSHGVVMHHALRHLLGASTPGLILATDNCGVHRLEWREFGVLRVAALNDTSHLYGLRSS